MTVSTTSKTFTFNDIPAIVAEVRRLATEYPDFRYTTPSGAGPCSNLTGGDSKYPELEGCIIGQAVRNLGFEIPAGCNVWTVDQLLSRLYDPNWQVQWGVTHRDLRGKQLDWLITVQKAQDENISWAAAIQEADNPEIL